MTITTTSLTLAEYLAYDDGTDSRYELVDGLLVAVALETGLHGEIMHFAQTCLTTEIERTGRSLIARQAAVSIRSPRSGRWETCRVPDVVVLLQEQWLMLRGREAMIELNEPAPKLVIEVVSESTRGTDYRAKRSEYAVLGIAEYWIVDPLEGKVTVCILEEGFYDAVELRGAELVASKLFPELHLSAEQLLTC